MIYTLTFNPALDYIVSICNLRLGCTNRTESEEIQFGGKGINVSIVLNNLGIKNTALGFLAGFTGQALDKNLKERGLSTDFIWLKNGLTRINIKIKGAKETEINAQGPAISERELNLLFEKLNKLENGDILILSGSIPPTLSDSTYKRILEHLNGRGIIAVVDAAHNLLRPVLSHKPFLIKPNIYELCGIFNKDIQTDEEIENCSKKLQKLGARNVLVSMAENGSLLLDETGKISRFGVPKGKVLNSVGSGDSMVAGFLAGWLKTGDYIFAHRMAAAAGSATAFSRELAEETEITALLKNFYVS